MSSLEDVVMQIARDALQQAADTTAATHTGRPIDEVREALRENLRANDASGFSDEELTGWAEVIARGDEVRFHL